MYEDDYEKRQWFSERQWFDPADESDEDEEC